MQSLEIYEDENSISSEDEYSHSSTDFSLQEHRFTRRMNLKEDVYYRTEIYEYKVLKNPVKVTARLIERQDEPPPDKYAVKDGVVLESEFSEDRVLVKDLISELKKEVEWHDLWEFNPETMFILLKNLPAGEFRSYLRERKERIIKSLAKIEAVIKEKDKTGLLVTDEYSHRALWYPKTVQDKMSEGESKRAIDYVRKLKEPLFDENSNQYVGISEGEFNSSVEILRNIEAFLAKVQPTDVFSQLKKQQEEKSKVTKSPYAIAGYIWDVVRNLITLAVVFYVYGQLTTHDSNLMFSGLLLIYLAVLGVGAGIGQYSIKTALLQLNMLLRTQKILFSQNPNGESAISKAELDEQEKELQQAAYQVEKGQYKFLINAVFQVILYITAIFHLLT